MLNLDLSHYLNSHRRILRCFVTLFQSYYLYTFFRKENDDKRLHKWPEGPI